MQYANNQALAHTLDEFSKLVKLSPSKLKLEIRAGRLTARKAGRRTLITDADGRKYIDSLPSAR